MEPGQRRPVADWRPLALRPRGLLMAIPILRGEGEVNSHLTVDVWHQLGQQWWRWEAQSGEVARAKK